MFDLSVGLVSLLAVCGGLIVLALTLAGVGFLLLKLGVIGHYWLKSTDEVQERGDYTLGQSKDIS